MGPPSHPLHNGGYAAAPSQVLGPRGLIDRAEYVRLLEQALRALGYDDVAAQLEAASGVVQQPPAASAFRAAVLGGQFDAALCLLPSVAADACQLDRARFLLLKSKYVELMETGATAAALQVLRTELQPLHVQQQVLHSLAALLLRPPAPAANGTAAPPAGTAGDHASGRSAQQVAEARAELLDELQDSLQDSLLIPERRLEELVEQALLSQLERCQYYNSRHRHLSLFSDYQVHVVGGGAEAGRSRIRREWARQQHSTVTHGGTQGCICGAQGRTGQRDALCAHVAALFAPSYYALPFGSLAVCLLHAYLDVSTLPLMNASAHNNHIPDRLTTLLPHWLPDMQAGAEQLPTQAGQVLEEHRSEVWSIVFSPCGQWAASASKDGTALLWSVTPAGRFESPRRLLQLSQPCQLVSFSPDSRLILTAAMDSNVRLHDVATAKLLRTFSAADADSAAVPARPALGGASSAATVMAVSWFPDSRRFLVATHRGMAIYDSHQQQQHQQQQQGGVVAAAAAAAAAAVPQAAAAAVCWL